MYIWRVLVFSMVLLLQPVVAAAETYTGEKPFSVMPGVHAGLVLAAGYGQSTTKDSYKSDNPWALPPLQQVPSFPRYFDSKKDTAPAADSSLPSTGKQDNTWSTNSGMKTEPELRSYTSTVPGSGGSSVSHESKPRYWFQQQPRFVTPEILDSIKQQQMRMQKTPLPWQQYYTPRTQRRGYQQNSQPQYPSWSSSVTLPVAPYALRDESLLYNGDSIPQIPDAALGGLPPLNVFETLPPELSGRRGSLRTFDPYSFGPFGDFIQ